MQNLKIQAEMCYLPFSLKGKGTKPPLPKITSFSPLGGGVGRKITIIGENFVNVIDVRIDGSVTFNVIDSTKIEAFVTANAFTSVIEVETSAGTQQVRMNLRFLADRLVTNN